MSEEQRIVEPLAKFHSSINIKGQLVVPVKDREILNDTKGEPMNADR